MKTVSLFDFQFVVSDLHSFSTLITKKIASGKKITILPTTLNEVATSHKSSKIKSILQSFDYLTMDGMPLVFLSHLKGFRQAKRIYGPELMGEVFSKGQSVGVRHFFYGGTSNILETLSANLQKKYPQSIIVGTYAPPFRQLTHVEKNSIIKQIKKSKPQVIWVGLGSEKQILWIDEFFDQINVSCIAVGAAFDFLAGVKPQAPIWMRRFGLEWLFRLLTEPTRLWRRYLIDIPSTIFSLVLNKIINSVPHIKILAVLVIAGFMIIVSSVSCFYLGEQYYFDKLFYKKSLIHGYGDNSFDLFTKRRLSDLRRITSEYEKKQTTSVLGERTEDKKVFKIAVIGDSIAFGLGVRQSQTFAVELEKKLNAIMPTKVYLLAQVGDDVINNFAKYELAKQFIQPDLFIIGMVENDLILNNYEVYPNQSSLLPLVSENCKKPLFSYNYTNPSESWENVVHDGFYPSFSDDYANICYLKNIVRHIKNNNTDVLWFNFSHYPEGTIVYGTEVQKEYRELYQKYESVIRNNGGKVIGADVTKLQLPPVSVRESHPSSKAHQVFANLLFDEIIKHKNFIEAN